MQNVMTIREAVRRASNDGLQISEYALRRLIKSGRIPVRMIGRRALVYYPQVVRYITCADGGDIAPAPPDTYAKIRRADE